MENTPVPIPFPECNECEGLIKQCQYLEDQIYQNYIVIESFVRGCDQKKTKKLFNETKEWSVSYFKQGEPLYYAEIKNTP